jgi:regulatory protein
MDIHAAALRLLNYRFRSVAEMERKLRDRGFSSDEIAAEIERLTEERWLDDARFAREYALSKLRARKGARRIEMDLRKFGVAKALIRDALSEAADEEDESTHLATLCGKKAGQIAARHGAAHLREDRGRKKLVAYLLSQGYDPSAVYDAVDREIDRRKGEEKSQKCREKS